jgi:DDE superfamily endonuclease
MYGGSRNCLISGSNKTVVSYRSCPPKTDYQWMPKGTSVEVLTPGKNEKHYPAGDWDHRTGFVYHCFGPRRTNQLLRSLLETRYPARRADNYNIHKAQAIQRWLALHPRFELLWLPADCPRAHPIERMLGDTHEDHTEPQAKAVARFSGVFRTRDNCVSTDLLR